MPIDISSIGYGRGNLSFAKTNQTDSVGNEILACAYSTFSTIAATAHNFLGATPNVVVLNQQTGTATATAAGTITSTQYTPTGGVSGTYTVLCYLGA